MNIRVLAGIKFVRGFASCLILGGFFFNSFINQIELFYSIGFSTDKLLINLLIFLWFLMLFVRWVSLMKYSILMNNWWVFCVFPFYGNYINGRLETKGMRFIGNSIVRQSISNHFLGTCFLEYSKIAWGFIPKIVYFFSLNFSPGVANPNWSVGIQNSQKNCTFNRFYLFFIKLRKNRQNIGK
jgi:hypothetical protein